MIISKAQGRALAKLEALHREYPNAPYASRKELKERTATLEALASWGFIARVGAYWRITEEGRLALPHVDVPA